MADPSPTASSSANLHDALRNIFESGEYHDLTVRSGDRTWKVHCAIICPQSRYFTKACVGGFKEAGTREIVLEGDEPDLVDSMLQYLYTGLCAESLHDDLVMAIKVYAIADKYELDNLKEVARTAFETAARNHWDTDEFVSAVAGAYRTTPDSDRGLRDIVKNITWCHQKKLLARKDIQDLLEVLEEFSMDLVRELCKTASSEVQLKGKTYCRHCGRPQFSSEW